MAAVKTPPPENPTKKHGRIMPGFWKMKASVWLPPEIAPIIEGLMAPSCHAERPGFLGNVLCEALLAYADYAEKEKDTLAASIIQHTWMSQPFRLSVSEGHSRRPAFLHEMQAIDEAMEKFTANGAPPVS
jgi:hypothetical protein